MFFPASSKPLTAQALDRWRNREHKETRWLGSRLPGESKLGPEFRYPAQLSRLSFLPPSPPQAAGFTPNSFAGVLFLGNDCRTCDQSCPQPCPYHRAAEQPLGSGPQQAAFVAAVSTASPLPAAADEKAG